MKSNELRKSENTMLYLMNIPRIKINRMFYWYVICEKKTHKICKNF